MNCRTVATFISLGLMLLAGFILNPVDDLNHARKDPSNLLVRPLPNNHVENEDNQFGLVDYLKSEMNSVLVTVNPLLAAQGLMHEAELGNGKSAYLLSQKLNSCFEVPSNEADLEVWLDQAELNGEPIALIDYVQENFSSCRGIDNEFKKHAIEYLILAAHLGYLPALEQTYFIDDHDYMKSRDYLSLTRDEYITEVHEFRKLKYQYLHHAIKLGSLQAMVTLGKAYQRYDAESGGINYGKAMAHFTVFLENTNDNEQFNSVFGLKQMLEQRMLLEDVIQSANEAELLRQEFDSLNSIVR